MRLEELESILLFVSDLDVAKRFYADLLGLPIIFEDGIVVVLKTGLGRVVLHRNDRGHDDRGIFPVGVGATGVAVRFSVDDPDAWEVEANQRGFPILWKTQEASWGRFVAIGDPDGRPVILAKMKRRLSRMMERDGLIDTNHRGEMIRMKKKMTTALAVSVFIAPLMAQMDSVRKDSGSHGAPAWIVALSGIEQMEGQHGGPEVVESWRLICARSLWPAILCPAP